MLQCSTSCGWGFRLRQSFCVSSNASSVHLPDHLCSETQQEATRRACKLVDCSRWVATDWSQVNHSVVIEKFCFYANTRSSHMQQLLGLNTIDENAEETYQFRRTCISKSLDVLCRVKLRDKTFPVLNSTPTIILAVAAVLEILRGY